MEKEIKIMDEKYLESRFASYNWIYNWNDNKIYFADYYYIEKKELLTNLIQVLDAFHANPQQKYSVLAVLYRDVLFNVYYYFGPFEYKRNEWIGNIKFFGNTQLHTRYSSNDVSYVEGDYAYYVTKDEFYYPLVKIKKLKEGEKNGNE